MPQHTVAQGDCIASIAFAHGFFPDTLWNYGENAGLKELREVPNVLQAGDVVVLPELIEKEVTKGCAARHRFRRKGVPAELNVRFTKNGQPRAHVAYTITLDGESRDGTTDGDGWVREPISPGARSGSIVLHPDGKDDEEYPLELGSLDPVETVRGQKARLKNMGFLSEAVNDEADEALSDAVSAFQRAEGLQVSGVADQTTQDSLKTKHGS